MFGLAGRRLAEAVVALFAMLGFAFVPLGRKTALEHARDILTTPAALSAWRELGGAADRLKGKLVEALVPAQPSVGELADPKGPRPELPALPPAKPGHK